MKRFCAAALAVIYLVPLLAWADTVNTGRFGFWTAFEGAAVDNEQVCGIMTTMTNGSAVMLKHYSTEVFLEMQAVGPGWSIPPGTKVPVRIAIDAVDPWTAMGKGHADMVAFTIVSGADMDRFIAAFTSGQSMRISFPGGTTPPWTVALAGTGQAVHALTNCMRRHMPNTGQPFSAPSPRLPAAPPAAPQFPA